MPAEKMGDKMFLTLNWTLRNMEARRSTRTLPVISSRCSEHHIVVVLGEGGGQALLAVAEPLVASSSAFAEVPVASVLLGGLVDGQVLAQDVAAARDVPRLLGGPHEQAPLVAVGARLMGKARAEVEVSAGAGRRRGGETLSQTVPLTTIFPPGP